MIKWACCDLFMKECTIIIKTYIVVCISAKIVKRDDTFLITYQVFGFVTFRL